MGPSLLAGREVWYLNLPFIFINAPAQHHHGKIFHRCLLQYNKFAPSRPDDMIYAEAHRLEMPHFANLFNIVQKRGGRGRGQTHVHKELQNSWEPSKCPRKDLKFSTKCSEGRKGEGGRGSKAFWTMLKKTARFVKLGTPLSDDRNSNVNAMLFDSPEACASACEGLRRCAR